jgi:hypothetical protein
MAIGNTEIVIGGYVPPLHSRALRLLVQYENAKDDFVFSSGIPVLYYGHTEAGALHRRHGHAKVPQHRRQRCQCRCHADDAEVGGSNEPGKHSA